MIKQFILVFLCSLFLNITFSQNNCSLSGNIQDANGQAIPGTTIYFSSLQTGVFADEEGNFAYNNLRCDTITVAITAIGFETQKQIIDLRKQNKIIVVLIEKNEELNTITITANKDYNNVRHMDDVEGTFIYAGKRNDVVILDKTNANTAENIPRQVFAKVPGVYQWDLDGSGNQTSIAVRGLNPHRSWEFNVRQNGYSVNSDAFGYPESHYNPPTEALSKVELVRGGACLQYGPQYGGMLNYVVKEGPQNKKADFETRQTFGSNHLFNTFNAIGGTVKKLNYYAYINYRNSDGFRPNSSYSFYAGYVGLHYAHSDNLKINLEYSRMYYLDQLAGGLTDEQFISDPYQSTRSRNYFQPDMHIPALTIDYKMNAKTTMSLKTNFIIGQRNSVMFIAPAIVEDTISASTLTYAPRTVDRDYYNSISNELRLLHIYTIKNKSQIFSAGIRFSNSQTHRQQKGTGTTGSDFDLTLIAPYELDLVFATDNYAVCVENLFRLTNRLSVTPGFRYEIIQTNYTGDIDYTTVPFNYTKNRNIPLAGIGMQYQMDATSNFYANITQAYRPILYSDLTPTGSYDVIDENMTDSKGFNSDLGIRGKIKEYLIYDIGIFYLQYGNRVGALALMNEDNIQYIYKTNVGTSAARGIESLIEFHPTEINNIRNKIGDIAIFIAATYDHATYIDAITSANGQDVQLKGNTLENAPAWIIRNGITYNYKFLSTTLQSSYVSEIYSDALNTESSASGVVGIVPSYFIIDWNTTFRFFHFNVKAGVNNLNNAEYFTRRINNYPGPGILPADGRTFYISVGKEF